MKTTKMAPGKKIRIILAIVGISFIQGLQFTVSPVLGKISEHFPNIDISLVQMLITMPAFVAMVFALLSGVLVLKFSKKQLLVFSSLLAIVTGFLPLFTDSFWFLFVCRTVYGVALGIAMALNTAVVAEWFTGDERVQVMGIQAASVGAGMVIVSLLGGFLGSYGIKASYFTNLVGVFSFCMIAFMLPASEEKGNTDGETKEKIRLNGRVLEIAVLGFFEFLFLITFTTNISMHISGKLAGSTSVSGTLTGIFSASQIVIGLLLGFVTKVTKKYTMPAAMISFAIGAVILVLFPESLMMLSVGAIFCGFSQGIFMPTGMVEVSNAVAPIAVALASGCFTGAANVSQTLSPFVTNTASKLFFGETTTSHVFTIAAIGMTLTAGIAGLATALSEKKEKQSKEK